MATSRFSAYHRRHLISHLLERDRVDEACHVLFARRDSGENVYFVVKEANADLPGLLNDVSATAARLRDQTSRRPGLELKLALLQCTVRNIVAREPLAMIGVRLRSGVWRRDDALRSAHVQQTSTRRAEALLAMAAALPHADNFVTLRQALNALRDPDSTPSSEVYTRLFDLTPAESRTEVLAEIISRGDRNALIAVLPRVPDHDVQAAITAGLEMTRAITADSPEGRTLQSEALLTEGVVGTADEHVSAAKAECIAQLSERAPDRDELFDEAWRYAAGITGDLRLQTQARALRSAPQTVFARLLAPLVEEALRSDVGAAMLARELASELDGSTLLELLARARQIGDPNARFAALSRVLPFLDPGEQAEVVAEALGGLEAAWTGEEKPIGGAREFALRAGTMLAPGEFARFLGLLDNLDDDSRFTLLLALVRVTGGKSEKLVAAALRQAAGVPNGYDELVHVFRFKDIVGSEGYHYLDLLLRYADEANRRWAALVDAVDWSLKGSIRPSAERGLQRMNDGCARTDALSAFAAALDPGPVRRSLVEAASDLCESLPDDDARLVALASLLRFAGATERGRITEQLTARVPEPGGVSTEALLRAIPFVDPTTRVRWAHRAAECVRRRAQQEGGLPGYQAAHWMSHTQFLPPGERDPVEAMLLASVGVDGGDDGLDLDAAAACLPYVSEIRRTDLAIRIFRARSAMSGPTRGPAILNTLAALPPLGNEAWPIAVSELAVHVWENAAELDCAVCRASLMGAAAVHRDDLPFAAAVEAASRIPIDWALSRALNGLTARRIGALTPDEALDGWRTMLGRAQDLSRSRFLVCVNEMVPVLRRAGGQQAVEEAARGLLDITTCWT